MFEFEGSGDLGEVAAKALVWARPADTALEQLARVNVSELAPEELRALTLSIERLRRYADAAEAHTLAALDTGRVTDTATGHRTSHWLAHNAGLPAGVARQRLVVANRLAAMLPEVDAALTSGVIGFDHARVFADVVNERNHEAITPLVGDLIDAAAGTVFTRWRANVTALASLLDPDGSHDTDGDLTRDRLTLSPSNGFMLVRGELTGETALSVHDTLNAVADELFAQFSRDCEQFGDAVVPSRATLPPSPSKRSAAAHSRSTATRPAHHGSTPPSSSTPTTPPAARSGCRQCGTCSAHHFPPSHSPRSCATPCCTPRSSTASASPSTWGEPPAPPPPHNAEHSPCATEAAPSQDATAPPRGQTPTTYDTGNTAAPRR